MLPEVIWMLPFGHLETPSTHRRNLGRDIPLNLETKGNLGTLFGAVRMPTEAICILLFSHPKALLTHCRIIPFNLSPCVVCCSEVWLASWLPFLKAGIWGQRPRSHSSCHQPAPSSLSCYPSGFEDSLPRAHCPYLCELPRSFCRNPSQPPAASDLKVF